MHGLGHGAATYGDISTTALGQLLPQLLAAAPNLEHLWVQGGRPSGRDAELSTSSATCRDSESCATLRRPLRRAAAADERGERVGGRQDE